MSVRVFRLAICMFISLSEKKWGEVREGLRVVIRKLRYQFLTNFF